MTDTIETDRDGSRDFDFQTGHWRIHNERLKERLKGCTEWETFEATQEARPLPEAWATSTALSPTTGRASPACRCASTIPAPRNGASTGRPTASMGWSHL